MNARSSIERDIVVGYIQIVSKHRVRNVKRKSEL